MIDANKAYELTKHSNEINKIKRDIENAVNQAIKDGLFECEVNINADTKSSVREEIIEWLIPLGYFVEMPKYKSQFGCPSDQMDYWNAIKISWEK